MKLHWVRDAMINGYRFTVEAPYEDDEPEDQSWFWYISDWHSKIVAEGECEDEQTSLNAIQKWCDKNLPDENIIV